MFNNVIGELTNLFIYKYTGTMNQIRVIFKILELLG